MPAECGASVETLVRVAYDACDAVGIRVSPSKLSKLIRFYARNIQPRGIDFVPWLGEQVAASGMPRTKLTAELYKRLTYADPTGEEAVHRASR